MALRSERSRRTEGQRVLSVCCWATQLALNYANAEGARVSKMSTMAGGRARDTTACTFGFNPAHEPATVAAQRHFPPPERPPAPSTYAAPPVSWAFLERAHHQK